MSKSIFIGVALAALFTVTLAQTQCLPQVRATYNVKAFFNKTYDVCNATAEELQALAGRLTTELFSASTGLDASCSATLDGDSVECNDERTKSNSESTKSNSESTEGTKGKGKERSRTSKGDKLGFDVVIACTTGSNPCLLTESNSISTVVNNFRGILEGFQLQNMQSLTLDDMMVDAMIRRPKVQRFCQVPSTLMRGKGKGKGKGKGRGRRPMTCNCPETCPM